MSRDKQQIKNHPKLTGLQLRIEVVQIDKDVSLFFINIPEGYIMKKLDFENHETAVLGRLKSFNKIKKISHWKEQTADIYQYFKSKLQIRGWDFENYPNPICFLGLYKR